MSEETTPEDQLVHELDERDILLEVLQLAVREPEKPIGDAIELVIQLGRVDLVTEAQEMNALVTEAESAVVEGAPEGP